LCHSCGAQFVKQYRSGAWRDHLFEEYVFGKQTLKQLAQRYGKTEKTIQRYLDGHQVIKSNAQSLKPVVLGMDCSFFGRGYGIILARSPGLKKNLYWREVATENKSVYREARRYLEDAGFNIPAVVLDIKPGIKEVFADKVIQYCHFHQQQIVTRYLTTRPKTEAGQELKHISDLLAKTDEQSFTRLLEAWHERWEGFLKEDLFFRP
jgi:hypothetical protein